jgi:hypothetical protein
MFAAPHASEASGGFQLTTALHEPNGVDIVSGADGHPVITGGVASVTVTENVHEADRPAASRTVRVTLCAPGGSDAPGAGAWVNARPALPQLSLTAAEER